MIFIICGVSGCGKTTIGQLLAGRLKVDFYDADDFHPSSNINKMSRGLPLTDEDRAPWLNRLADNFLSWNAQGGAVLACSALKESYRILLTSQCNEVEWITLNVPEEVLFERLKTRKHFFNQCLLHSQLETFETPRYGSMINAVKTPNEIIEEIVQLNKTKIKEKLSSVYKNAL